MDVSILIVNWNTRDYLRDCLRSIRNTVRDVEHEVIVVDNASADGSAEMVGSEFPDVRLIASPENLGFARGNNVAMQASAGDYLLVMNPDILLREGTVAGLVAFARQHPEAGILSPKLLNPDGTVQSHIGRIPTLSTVLFLYTAPGRWVDARLLGNRIRRRDRYEDHGDFQEVLWSTDGGAGFCCTLIPRSLLEQIGFMDERFPVFFNDGDFARRLFRAGYQACILPHVQAVHFGGSSVKQLDRLAYNREFVYGLLAYSRKHRGWIHTRAVEAALGLNVPAEALAALRNHSGGSGLGSAFREPARAFRAAVRYHPPNAHPGIAYPDGATRES